LEFGGGRSALVRIGVGFVAILLMYQKRCSHKQRCFTKKEIKSTAANDLN